MKIKLEPHVKTAEANMLNDNDEFGQLPEYDPYTLYTESYEPMTQISFENGKPNPTAIGSGEIKDLKEFEELSKEEPLTIYLEITDGDKT